MDKESEKVKFLKFEIKNMEKAYLKLSKELAEKDREIQKHEEFFDAEIGYYYEAMDFQTMAEHAVRCDNKIESQRLNIDRLGKQLEEAREIFEAIELGSIAPMALLKLSIEWLKQFKESE